MPIQPHHHRLLLAFAFAQGCSPRACFSADPVPRALGCVAITTGDASRTVEHVERDAQGRVVLYTQVRTETFDTPEQYEVKREFGRDRVIEVRKEEREESGTTRVVYTLDDKGRVTSSSETKVRVLFEYDGERLTREVYPNTKRAVSYRHVPAAKQVEAVLHKEDGSQEPPQIYLVDIAGRLLERREPRSDGATHVVRYQRDETGAIVQEVEDYGDGTMARTRCTLDELHRPRACTWDFGADGVVETRTTYRYGRRYGSGRCEDHGMLPRPYLP